MKTDNYKLALFVPEKESQMPCDKCPIADICHAYNSYLVYNEIEHGVPVTYYIVFALLPESVRRLGKDFLSKVQILHDGDDYWYFNSLSDKGKQKVNSLIDSYCS